MEPNVKGYAIRAATQYVLGDPHIRPALAPDFVEKLSSADSALKMAEWYPRSRLMEIYTAIANVTHGEKETYEALTRCGRATAEGATKGYMKLVLKILTPRLFAGKFPDFWARDHQSGHAEVTFPEPSRHMIFHLYDMNGFDHIGPVAAGVVAYLMETIGEKGVEVTCSPWSLADPAPKEVSIDIRWQ